MDEEKCGEMGYSWDSDSGICYNRIESRLRLDLSKFTDESRDLVHGAKGMMLDEEFSVKCQEQEDDHGHRRSGYYNTEDPQSFSFG